MQQTREIEILKRALHREKESRKAAEQILEQKSTELYHISEQLQTSNKKLEELLNSKTSELEGVFENIIDAYVVMEISGEVIRMNQAAIDLLGYDISKEKFNLRHLVKEEFQEYTNTAFTELYHKGKFNNYNAVILTKNKEEKIVQINASIIYDRAGKPIAAQGIARDITEETRIKTIVEDQKRKLDVVFNHSPIGISLADSKAEKLIFVNNAVCEMLGFTKEELLSHSASSITHPDDEDRSQELRSQLYEGKIDTYTLEKRYLKKDKSYLWVKTSVTAVRDNNGELDYQVATVEDITKEKVAKERLKESENRLSRIIMNLQSGILLEDENRKIRLTNQQFCDIFNIPAPPAALINVDCTTSAEESKMQFHDPEGFVKRIQELLENKKTVIAEELQMVDGRVLERSYIPIFNNGEYKGHLWSYDDITIRRRYKENLKAQKDKYSNIIANMNLGLVEVDNEDHIIMANQSFCDISGYTFDELVGKKAAELLLLEEYIPDFYKKNQEREKGISDSYEVKIKTKNNELRNWLISGAPNYDVNGNVVGSIGIHLDITTQKQLEEQQKELLKSLEVQNEQLNDYAHVVSHDLKSPLRNISALISWTREDFKDKVGEDGILNLDLMQNKVEKMDHLIENILKYSSLESHRASKTIVNLQDLVKDIVSMIYIPDHIKVIIKRTLPIIEADATRMQQVFQNIISNAVNYIDKEEGLIEIDVTEDDEHYIFSIKDNGCGIEEEHFEKIFKIFSSVNSSKTSSGIGLSIVKKIIEIHDGKIWLESEFRKGTTFFFTVKKSG